MSQISLQQWSLHLQDTLAQSHQRLIIDCEGDLDWCLQVAQNLAQNKTSLTLSDQDSSLSTMTVSQNKSIQLLGQEFEVVIFDAFNGFDVDAFTRALGLIKAPGLLVLIHPKSESWLQQHDLKNTWQNQQQGHHYFLTYLQNELSQSKAVLPCHQDNNLYLIDPLEISEKAEIKEPLLLSEQQGLAWNSLDTIFETNDQSFALLAERGRGKSTLLGRWISQKHLPEKQFTITSDSKKAAGNCLRYSQDLDNVNYQAIDDLLKNKPQADCIIVDEAATIPVALLFELKHHYKRVIYTTTLDGYEGTGQGFEQQFLASFNTESLKIIKLLTPIRWGNNDLLEDWMKKTFLLSHVAIELKEKSELNYQRISQSDLSQNKELLQQVFHLLKTSHYRTQSSDLRMLFDNPDITLFIAKSQTQVIAVMLLIAEGGLEAKLTTDIYYGKRRPLGHLLAQGMTVHAGCEGFAELKGFRVQRIAVAQPFRQQGIGSQLIQLALEHAKQQQAAYLGAVFALDEKRINFWQSNQMDLVMISVGQGTSTGKPSVTMLLALDQKVDHVKQQCQKAFKLSFSERLLTHYQSMPALQVASLLSLMPSIGVNNAKECDAYINGFKGFEYALSDLRSYVLFLLQQQECSLSEDDQSLLISAILQYQPWPEIIKSYSLSGKKELNQRLKDILKT